MFMHNTEITTDSESNRERLEKVLANIERQMDSGSDKESWSWSTKKYIHEATDVSIPKPITRDEFDKKIEGAEVVLVEDFHSSSDSKGCLIDICDRVQPDVIALECLPSRYDTALAMPEAKLAELVKRFGFDYEVFKPVFDYARENAIEVRGIDSEGSESARDVHAAKILSGTAGKVVAFIGGKHMYWGHLPNKIKNKKVVTVRNDPEHVNDSFVKFDESELGVACTTNVAKSLSWTWQHEDEEYADSYKEVVLEAITEFFGIDDKIYDPEDGGAVSDWGRLSEKIGLKSKVPYLNGTEDAAKEMIFYQRARGNAVLADGSIVAKTFEPNAFAESVGMAISNIEGGCKPNYAERFAFAALKFAAGYLASKVINHRRKLPEVEGQWFSDIYDAAKVRGYELGEQLWQELMDDEISVDFVRREIFEKDLSRVGAAAETYRRLCDGELKKAA